MPELLGADGFAPVAEAALELRGRRRRRGAVHARMGRPHAGSPSREIHQSTNREDTGLRVRVVSKGRVGVAATNDVHPRGRAQGRAERQGDGRDRGARSAVAGPGAGRADAAGGPVLRGDGERLARDARRSRRRPDRHVRTRVHGRRRLRDPGDGGRARQHRGPALLGAVHAGLGHHGDVGRRGRQRLRRDVLRIGRDDRRRRDRPARQRQGRGFQRSPRGLDAGRLPGGAGAGGGRHAGRVPGLGGVRRHGLPGGTGPASAARRTSRWRRPRSRSGTTAPIRARWAAPFDFEGVPQPARRPDPRRGVPRRGLRPAHRQGGRRARRPGTPSPRPTPRDRSRSTCSWTPATPPSRTW